MAGSNGYICISWRSSNGGGGENINNRKWRRNLNGAEISASKAAVA